SEQDGELPSLARVEEPAVARPGDRLLAIGGDVDRARRTERLGRVGPGGDAGREMRAGGLDVGALPVQARRAGEQERRRLTDLPWFQRPRLPKHPTGAD